MYELIVISNRLPVTLKACNGKYEYIKSSGGLVSALDSVKESSNFIWVGWPGNSSFIKGIEVPLEDQKQIRIDLIRKYSCVPVFLEKKVADNFYNIFSNGILWPLFHYFPEEIEFDESSWASYKEANMEFLKELLNIYKENSSIWVQDYQLMLLPKYIREKLPNAKVGFFLHIPFLSSEIYRALPSRKEILEGVLGSDLIGFHTYDYARHFVNSCNRVLKCEAFSNRISFCGRTTLISVIPIGIDPKEFRQKLTEKETEDKLNLLKAKFKGKIVILGVDRLDYIKGIPNKLLAFKKFLENNPKYRGKVILFQVAIPSRTNVSEYQKLRSYINEIVGEINGTFGISLDYLRSNGLSSHTFDKSKCQYKLISCFVSFL